MGTKEAQNIEGESGAVIPAYADARSTWVKSTKKFNLQAFIDMLDYYKLNLLQKIHQNGVKLETNELKESILR